jgi:hypothetical protein
MQLIYQTARENDFQVPSRLKRKGLQRSTTVPVYSLSISLKRTSFIDPS